MHGAAKFRRPYVVQRRGSPGKMGEVKALVYRSVQHLLISIVPLIFVFFGCCDICLSLFAFLLPPTVYNWRYSCMILGQAV